MQPNLSIRFLFIIVESRCGRGVAAHRQIGWENIPNSALSALNVKKCPAVATRVYFNLLLLSMLKTFEIFKASEGVH